MIRLLSAMVLMAAAWGQGSLRQSFEVASVRMYSAPPNAPVMKNPGVDPIHISGNRVELRRMTLKDLVMAAYDVKEHQVTGGAEWTRGVESMFDIAATTGGASSVEQVQAMLRNLLMARFHLTLRHESKEMAVYNLVVAKGGPKMKRVAGDTAAAANMRLGTAEQIAALMSLYLDRPVLDKTGLTGVYEYSSQLMLLDMGAPDAAEVIAKALAALEESLGLKAQAAKAKLDVLVIVSADTPAPN